MSVRTEAETDLGRIGDALRRQSLACDRLGSPMYADLLRRAAEDPEPAAAVLGADIDTSPRAAVALRLFGAVHRLVLAGRARELAAHYPSVGGRYQGARTWEAVRSVLAGQRDEISVLLAVPPQTNEVGRAAVLIGGLLHVAARTRLPLRLLELGASAGLNLRADRFRCEYGRGRFFGPASSPTVIRDAWRPGGALPPLDAPLRIVGRRGCDRAPVDPSTDEGRLRLTSYIWPDQAERFDRTRGACTIAAGIRAPVDRMAASEFLAGLTPVEGITTVVWHSVVRQYATPEEWERVESALARAGAQASSEAPVAHLAFEPRTVEGSVDFPLTLRLWPGDGADILGTGHAHGTPMTWH